MLDIYPKTNGTVKITYGGLTKTITDTSGAAEPNAQQVFFGTFNGVSDTVTTPLSGTLTIEGDYNYFAVSDFNAGKNDTATCSCITSIEDTGNVTSLTYDMISGGGGNMTSIYISQAVMLVEGEFMRALSLQNVFVDNKNSYYSSDDKILFDKNKNTVIYACRASSGFSIPSSVTTISDHAFSNCAGLTSITIPSSVTTIDEWAFSSCGLTSITIPQSVTTIGENTFYNCASLTNVVINSSITGGFYVSKM